MLIDIEDLTMEEYEILVRGGNSPGQGRLSVMEITKEEYDEMIWRRSGSELDQLSFPIGDKQRPPEFYADEEDFTDEDEDREWEELDMWLADKISSPTSSLPNTTPSNSQESGTSVTEIFNDFSNIFVDSEQEMIEETWFDAPVFDEEEELEQSLEDEPAELNVFLTKEPDTKFLANTEFVGDRELLEIEYLMEHDGATFLDESVLNQRIEEWAKTRTKRSNEAAENAKENLNSEPIRRMPIKGHTPYAPGNINTPYVNFGHTQYETSVPKTSFWQDVFGKEVTHLNPRCEEVILRETREWQDARVKLHKVLVKSNEALVLDDCLIEAG